MLIKVLILLRFGFARPGIRADIKHAFLTIAVDFFFFFSIKAYNIDEKFTIDRYTFTIFLGEKEEKRKLK